MNRGSFIVLIILFIFGFVYPQNSITLSLPTVDVSNFAPGDDLIIPITLVDRSPDYALVGSLWVGHNFYFKFDHNYLKWKGNSDNPLPGVKNFSPLCSYSSDDWLFNDNGEFQICLWIHPRFSGDYFPDSTILFEYIYTYLGGLKSGDTTALTWSINTVIKEGLLLQGKSEAYTDKMKPYDEINLINGKLFSR